MDNITHSLTGVFLARAGLSRLSPQATFMAVLAANVPDADAVSYLFGGSIEYLHFHRGITHSLLAVPLMALLPLLIAKLATKGKFLWWKGYLVCLIAGLTHPLLDWTNMYGVRLLSPWKDDWYRLDVTYVIDLAIWCVFLVALAGPAISRLVSSEIGARAGLGRGWAWMALLGVVAINGGRYILHERAVGMLDTRIYDGEAPRRVAALPRPVNPFVWDGLVETADAYRGLEVNVLAPLDVANPRILFKPEMTDALQAAQNTRTMRRFLGFSQFPLLRVMPAPSPEGAILVEAQDLRFGLPPERRFVATCLLSPQLLEISSSFTFGPFR